MNFINRMSTVLFLLIGAYGVYSGWSFREFAAFFFVGVAVDFFFNSFKSKPDIE